MDFFIAAAALIFSTGFWFWLVRRKDRFAPEPFWFLCKIMLLGGLMSTIPSGVLNSLVIDPDATAVFTSFWQNCFVGLNEEFWKLFATAYLIRNHRHFDEPVDGIIYAATVALGFAALENIEYISRYGLDVLVFRHFSAIPAHIAFAMLWGYGLTLAKFKYPKKNWVYVVFPFYLAAALFHALYNFSVSVLLSGLDVLIAAILVVFLYRYGSKKTAELLLHSPLRPVGHCSFCTADNSESSKFCSHCGKGLVVTEVLEALQQDACQYCNALNAINNKFCVQCGEQSDFK